MKNIFHIMENKTELFQKETKASVEFYISRSKLNIDKIIY